MIRGIEPEDNRFREAVSSALGALAARAARDRAVTCSQDPEEIWRAANGALLRDATRELLRHGTHCSTCAEAWKLAAAMLADPRPSEEARTGWTGELRQHRFRWWPAVGIGTAGLAAAVLLVVFLRGYSPETPAFRSPHEIEITPRTPSDALLARDRFLLQWDPAPVGTFYTVEITTEDLVLLNRSSVLTRPEYQVPQSAFEGLSAGERVFWRVEGTLPEGDRIHSAVLHATLK